MDAELGRQRSSVKVQSMRVTDKILLQRTRNSFLSVLYSCVNALHCMVLNIKTIGCTAPITLKQRPGYNCLTSWSNAQESCWDCTNFDESAVYTNVMQYPWLLAGLIFSLNVFSWEPVISCSVLYLHMHTLIKMRHDICAGDFNCRWKIQSFLAGLIILISQKTCRWPIKLSSTLL